MADITFSADIMPKFKQYQGPMMWRLDITNYDEVVENVVMITSRITATDDSRMPPPPFPPLPQDFIETFLAWVAGGKKP